MTIEIDNLRISFGDKQFVKGVSFNVARGASFGIVGESGSGKSTVLRAMAGLNNDWSGRIAFSGEDAPLFRPPAFFRKGCCSMNRPRRSTSRFRRKSSTYWLICAQSGTSPM